MARPRGNLKAATGRARKQDNLSSLSTEVLCLRLQALNLPITGSKAYLVSRLQAVQHPRAAPRTKPGRVQKRSITTSRRFKCVPQILGSLSIHIFKLLFSLLSNNFRQ